MKILDNMLEYIKRERQDQAVNAALEAQGDTLPTESRTTARWGLIALAVGGGGFLLWALIAPLSQGIPVTGFIKVEGNSKTVQHLRGGIVEEILVKEGDRVELNQPLLRLNDTQIKAQYGIVESQLITALAVEARLLAEQRGRKAVEYPEFLLERKNQIDVREIMVAQSQLFRTRRSALANEESIARETITGLEQQIQGYVAQEQARSSQIRLFKEERDTLRPLYEEGYIPRTRMFELDRTIAFLNGQHSEDIASIGRARSQVSEIRLKILQSRQIYQKEVETQLTDTQRQVADLRERFVATRDELERAVVRSPASGLVYGLTVSTVGGVVSPGQKLMDVLPEGTALLIEVQIPTNLIDNAKIGLNADISFPALDRFQVSHVPGRLVYISADRFTDPRTDAPYFLGRVEVTADGLKALAGHELQPGMPANVVIVTGERTMIGYLLRPIFARLHFAFTER